MALENTQDDGASVQFATPRTDDEERHPPAGTMSERAFSRVIESHAAWLSSYGCEGRRAILDKLDLRLALGSDAFAHDRSAIIPATQYEAPRLRTGASAARACQVIANMCPCRGRSARAHLVVSC
jgi:hypothetical protein